MSNIFDKLQANAEGIVRETMGFDASWTPAAGGLPEFTGRILLKEPTEKDNLRGVEYNPFIYLIEYFGEDFQGLKESSDAGTIETLIVNGEYYEVRIVVSMYDGKTFVAISEKVES